MTDHTQSVTADGYFAIIPEWVLDADISSHAVRLYGVLRRYADQNGQCFPSRRTLANRCKVSESTLDRVMKELIHCGAVSVDHRTSGEGDFASNLYMLHTARGVASSVKPPGVIGEGTGGVTSDELTRAIVNESHEPEHMVTVPVTEKTAPVDFERFWGQYPRKVGKEKALKVWGRLSRGDRNDALWALPRHVALWEQKQVAREFIPHPTSWLNGRRWQDDIDGELQTSKVQPSRSAPGMGVIRAIMQGQQGELR